MDKVAAGRARKDDKKNAAKAAEEARQQAIEDASWEEGAKKGNKKKEAAADKAAEKAARKAENDADAASEEASFSEKKRTGKSGANKAGGAKMTRAEIAAKALAKAEEDAKAKANAKKAIETSGCNDYIGELTANTNKQVCRCLPPCRVGSLPPRLSMLSLNAAACDGDAPALRSGGKGDRVPRSLHRTKSTRAASRTPSRRSRRMQRLRRGASI